MFVKNMKDAFLYELAATIQSRHGDDLEGVCIVLPSQRASLFLKRYISMHYQKAIWSPEIYTIQQFSERLSQVNPVDSISLIFRLFDVYRKVFGEQAESLEGFLKWGGMMLNDYNEIDNYLVDAQSFYSNLSEIKDIEEWSFGKGALTENQQNYLQFWKKLGVLYQQFTAELRKEEMGYQGLIARIATERLSEDDAPFEGKQVYFAGLNALSQAEQVIIKHFVKSGTGHVFWDADEYYLHDPKHEAGMFIQRHAKDIQQGQDLVVNRLKTETKNMHVHALPIQTAEAKYAGELLKNLAERDPNFENTAIVLADESLILPLLHALPDEVKHVNVTMGFPLMRTPLFALVELYFNMIKKSRKSEKQLVVYYQDLLRFFDHPYLRNLIFEDRSQGNAFKEYIVKNNTVYIGLGTLLNTIPEALAEKLQQLQFLFEHKLTVNGKEMLQTLKAFVLLLSQYYDDVERYQLENEYFIQYSKVLNRLDDILTSRQEALSLEAFVQLHRTAASSNSLAFYGEPLKGLQVMGVLEARAIDFENLIFLSVNEGNIPKPDRQNSFIPFDLRSYFKLPGVREKEAVYAYHFYRTIQRAKNIHLLYVNSEADGLKTSEKSRYITQIESELKEQKIQFNQVSVPIEIQKSDTAVKKDDFVLERIKKHLSGGLSPSAMNKYIMCPLDYYYSYILGMQEEDDVEEHVEHSTFGNVVHNTLEELFKPFENHVINSIDVKQMFKLYESLVLKEFEAQNFKENALSSGKNYIVFQVVCEQVKTFLESQVMELEGYEKKGEPVKILMLEKTVERTLQVEVDGQTIPVQFRGKVDRIDLRGNELCVIDYKTGSVKTGDFTQIKDIEQLFKPDKSKALQLLTYAWMCKDKTFEHANITPSAVTSGIYSLRKNSFGLKCLQTNDDFKIGEEDYEMFESFVTELIREMLDSDIPLKHHAEAKYCGFCY